MTKRLIFEIVGMFLCSALFAQDPVLLLPLKTDSTYRGYYIYNDFGGIPTTYEEMSTAYSYDSSGRVAQFRQYQEESDPNFPDKFRFTYTYVGNDAVVLGESKIDSDDWVLYARRTEHNNAQGQLDSVRLENLINGDWKLISKSFYTYNADHLLTFQGYQYWSDTLQAWVNSRQYTWQYDSNQNLTQTQTIYWYAGNNFGTIQGQNDYEYDALGRRLKLVESYNLNGALFQSRILEYKYASDNLSDTLTIYKRTSTNDTWKPEGRLIYHYNALGELLDYYHEIRQSNSWVPAARTLFTPSSSPYTSSPGVELIQGYDHALGVYGDDSRITRHFEDLSNGKVFFQYKREKKDYLTQVWEEHEVRQIWYHLPAPTPTKEIGLNKFSCQPPNPYQAGQLVQCPDLQPNRQYVLRLFSIEGRLAYELKFRGEEGWQINHTLPTGLYVATIFQNDRLIGTRRLFFE